MIKMCKFSIEPGRQKVRKWMEENDYSYNDLAKLSGYSKQTVYQYITGKNDGKAAGDFIKGLMRFFRIN